MTKWWKSAINALLDLPWPDRVVLGSDGPKRCTEKSRVLSLSEGAAQLFMELRANIEPRLKPETGDLCGIRAFASKLPGAIARIALALQGLVDAKSKFIDAEVMAAACAWASFLVANFQHVTGDAVEPLKVHHARRLADALGRYGVATITESKAFDLIRTSAMPDMDTFRPVLDELFERGYIRRLPPDLGKPGRPSRVLEVNPAFLANYPVKPVKPVKPSVKAGITSFTGRNPRNLKGKMRTSADGGAEG